MRRASRMVRELLAGGAVVAIVSGCGGTSASPSAATVATNQASQSAGWSWTQITRAPWDGYVLKMTNGLVSTCGQWPKDDVCTSRDGVTWQVPADPSVFALESPGKMDLYEVAKGPAGWLLSDPGGLSSDVWGSRDGVRWSTFVPIATPECRRFEFVGLSDRYLGRCMTTWFESADAIHWTTVSLPEPIEYIQGDAEWGLLGSGSGRHWYSRDGRSWSPLTLPDGLNSFLNSYRASLPGGSLMATAWYVASSGESTDPRLVESADGVTWRRVATFPGAWPTDVMVAGDTVFVIDAGVDGSSAPRLWLSRDGGATWTAAMTGKNSVGHLLTYKERVIVNVDGVTYEGRLQ
jgi:hypothetical protein